MPVIVVSAYQSFSVLLGANPCPPLTGADTKRLPGYNDQPPYIPPKKKRSKWWIIAIPLLIIVIIAAVVGGVLGSRKNNNSGSSSSGSGGSNGPGTADGAHSSILHQQGRFAVTTDAYFLPVYPSTVSLGYHGITFCYSDELHPPIDRYRSIRRTNICRG